MGEAKRRAAQRVQSQQEVARGGYRWREKVCLFAQTVYDALEAERAIFNETNNAKLDFTEFHNLLLMTGIEREVALRELEKATPKQVEDATAELQARLQASMAKARGAAV